MLYPDKLFCSPVDHGISRIIEERGKEGKGNKYTMIGECILHAYCYLGYILLLINGLSRYGE